MHFNSKKELSTINPPKVALSSEQVPKIKKKIDSQRNDEIKKELSLEEREELQKTESEIDIRKESLICVVHKDPIVGTVYICPQYQTFYYQECVKAFKKNGEGCWSCNRKID